MSRKAVVFGSGGQLGVELLRELRERGYEVTGFERAHLDITDPAKVEQALASIDPQFVYNAAAYNQVDVAETEPAAAYSVNALAVRNLALACRQVDARLIHFSTDYVFDGTKATPYTTDDPRAPRSVYGKSKAEAEERLSEILPDCCVVRTSWLFGVGGKCFPDTILKLAASRPQLEVVGDQRGSPTYVVDLARAIVQLCRKAARGIVHATNRGDCSWFEFAREIISSEGLDTVVRETTSDKFVRPAERPKYSVLSPASLKKYGVTMPEWQDALQRYLAERKS